MTTVRVLLVDSNDAFLDGLSAWLGREPNVEIVGSARTGVAAVDLVGRLRPDLLLMDVSMSSMNGFEATRKIKSNAEAPIVVLTTFHDSDAARNEAWAAGADDLIDKAEITGSLRQLIRKIVAGHAVGGSREQPRTRAKSRSSAKQIPKGDFSQ